MSASSTGTADLIVRSDADAHDAVQSTFARAFEALRRGQRDAPVRPWLYRIAHNESVTVIRARKAGTSFRGISHHTSLGRRIAPATESNWATCSTICCTCLSGRAERF